MERLLKHKILIGLVAVLVVASGGAAYAATQTSANPQQALLNDVAKRLNVSPAQLRSALRGALVDRLEAAVKAGQLTQAQANKLKQRIENGALPLGALAGGGFLFPGPRGFLLHGPGGFLFPGPGLGKQFGAPGLIGFVGPFAAASKYLGISRSQLLSELRGKTLAQVAQAHGKSVSGLEQAIVSAQRARLDHLVTSGVLTKAQEQRRLSLLSQRVSKLVEHARVMVAPYGKTAGGAPSFHRAGPLGVPPALFGAGGPPAGGPAVGVPAGGPGGAPPPAA